MKKEKIERAFKFDPDFVSCSNCALCYDASAKGPITPKERTFCQEFSVRINPSENERNHERAKDCPFWIPSFGDRSVMSSTAKERKRWYERGEFE